MRHARRARVLAGAFLMLTVAFTAGAERLRVAAERPDASCPADPKALPGVIRLGAA